MCDNFKISNVVQTKAKGTIWFQNFDDTSVWQKQSYEICNKIMEVSVKNKDPLSR
jgi:hypothetical protein